MFALPLVNMVGLFLEEAEEKDYLGLFSFIALSYIVAPFQGYAALKGFLEKKEGPWFRTPKTGVITDIFTPGRFYRYIFGGEKKEEAKTHSGAGAFSSVSHYMALSTSNNIFDSIKPKRKRMKFLPRAVIAVFLIVTIMLNYLTFFLPKAHAANVGFEQQINIEDYTVTTTSTTPSLMSETVHWTPGNYSGTKTVYFEAVICNTSYNGGKIGYPSVTTTVGLYTKAGVLVTNSNLSVSQTSCTWSRQRTVAITLAATDTDYVIGVSTSDAQGTAEVKLARIIVVQSDPSWITNTETQIEVGNKQYFTNTSYATLTDPKIYLYDDNVFTPRPTVHFEAVLYGGESGTTCKAQLYDLTDSTAVANSEVSVTGQTPTLATTRAGIALSLDTTNDDEYVVQIETGGLGGCNIASAKIVLIQADTTNGITALETMQQSVNYTQNQGASTSPAYFKYLNYFMPGNFSSGTFAYYYEATIKNGATTAFTINSGSTFGSTNAVSTNSTTWIRKRGAAEIAPSVNTEWDANVTGSAGGSGYIGNAWIVVQISSLQVPENNLFLIPFVFFLPKIVSKIRRKKTPYLRKLF